jgi:hypothetical protein
LRILGSHNSNSLELYQFLRGNEMGKIARAGLSETIKKGRLRGLWYLMS